MENNRTNSNEKPTESQTAKDTKKITKTPAKIKKKRGFKRFVDSFIQEDAGTVTDYIFDEVLIPAIKKTFSDIVSNALDMFLWGKRGSRGRSSGSSVASRVTYRDCFDDNRVRRREPERSRSYRYDDILIETRNEAEAVLARMDELIADYGVVSIADFYDLVGVTARTTDNGYGWSDLRTATIVHDRDGYLIKFPRAIALD